MPKFLQFRDPRRKMHSFWRHAIMLFQPTAAAVAAVAIWYTLWSAGISFPHEDEIVLTAVGVAVPAILFSILAALLITESYKRYQYLTECLFAKDRLKFLHYRDERFPVTLHLLQIALSTPIIVISMGLAYASVWSGIAVVFAATFVVTLYWVAIVELQNPAKSPWFAERIPEEWLLADVDALCPIDAPGCLD